MDAEPQSTAGGGDPPAAASAWLRMSGVPWRELIQSGALIVVLTTAAVVLTLHFVRPAPPRTLTFSSGPKGSTFETIAERYRRSLARNGIELKIVNSEGSLDNLRRLADPRSGVDIAFVQSGIAPATPAGDLDSLGAMFFEPLTIFYRGSKPLQRLSELRGQRIAIGREGSGTRALALALLKANEIEPGGTTTLVALEGEDATRALLRKEVDAVFLTGDSAAPAMIRELLHTEGLRLFDFPQADAYVRRFPYLSKLTLPAGAFDLGENLPPASINMLAPTVDLIAHSSLHPALSDLLIEAATEVHGRASLLQVAGQFPTPVAHSFPVSPEAVRYYKSGNKGFFYRFLPFWLASLIDRALIVLVPALVVVIPGLRFLPQVYGWRVRRRIHRHYSELMALERESLGSLTDGRRTTLYEHLERIERSVIAVKMPGAYADQLYLLRQHIGLVRDRLMRADMPLEAHPPAH